MKLLSKKKIKEFYDTGKINNQPEVMALARMAEAHRASEWRKRIDKRLKRNRKKRHI
jgi:hypothetical protein